MLAPLEIFASLALLFWILLLLDRRRAWPSELRLRQPGEGPGAEGSVVGIVPARNEASVLPETLPALLSQDADGLEIVLVDDRSEDGSGAIAQRLAEASGAADRLSVVRPPEAPPGWSGKVHAQLCGVEEAMKSRTGSGPEWFLFTDADIRHHPGSLRALLSRAAAGPSDMVSVMARLHAANFWERLLIPPFVFFFQLLYPFRLVRRSASRVAAAAGGCVLVRRSTLEAAGGLEAIRSAVIDDVALAKAVKNAGGRLWLGFDPEIVSVRQYRSLGQLWKMVSRSAFVQLRYRYDLVALVILGLVVFCVAPPVLMFGAIGGGLNARVGSGELASAGRSFLWAALAWIGQTYALYPSVRHHRVPRVFAVTLPLSSFLYALMTLTSAWNLLTGRGTTWKGRTYGPA